MGFGRSLTSVFSNHPSVFQGFTREALHSFPGVAALWLHWEQRVHKDLKEIPSSNTYKTALHTSAALFHQSPTARLLPRSLTSKEREINYSKARQAGCVRAPEDTQVPPSSQKSLLTAEEGWGSKTPN